MPTVCYYFLVANASVINHSFTSLALMRSPVSLIVVWFVPRMLGAVATQMSLFVTSVALNFAQVSLSSSPLVSLHESSSGNVSSAGHSCWIHLLTSCNTASGSSCRCIHCIWVEHHVLWHPSSLVRGSYTSAMCL